MGHRVSYCGRCEGTCHFNRMENQINSDCEVSLSPSCFSVALALAPYHAPSAPGVFSSDNFLMFQQSRRLPREQASFTTVWNQDLKLISTTGVYLDVNSREFCKYYPNPKVQQDMALIYSQCTLKCASQCLLGFRTNILRKYHDSVHHSTHSFLVLHELVAQQSLHAVGGLNTYL